MTCSSFSGFCHLVRGHLRNCALRTHLSSAYPHAQWIPSRPSWMNNGSLTPQYPVVLLLPQRLQKSLFALHNDVQTLRMATNTSQRSHSSALLLGQANPSPSWLMLYHAPLHAGLGPGACGAGSSSSLTPELHCLRIAR